MDAIELLLSLASLGVGYWVAYHLYRFIFGIFCSRIVANHLSHALLITVILGLIFIVSVYYLTRDPNLKSLPLLLAGILLALNIVTIPFYYWYDKRLAIKGGESRIPENVLHTLAMVGGGFSAVLSQKLFHHKTQKKRFQQITILAIISTLLLFYIIFTYRQVLLN